MCTILTATGVAASALPVRPDTVIGLLTVALSLIATSAVLVYVCVPAPPTVTDLLMVLLAPPLSVTVSATVYVPEAAYVLAGLVAVEAVLSPKFQLRLAMLPSLSVDVSVKLAVKPLTLDVKLATGATLPPPPVEVLAASPRNASPSCANLALFCAELPMLASVSFAVWIFGLYEEPDVAPVPASKNIADG